MKRSGVWELENGNRRIHIHTGYGKTSGIPVGGKHELTPLPAVNGQAGRPAAIAGREKSKVRLGGPFAYLLPTWRQWNTRSAKAGQAGGMSSKRIYFLQEVMYENELL